MVKKVEYNNHRQFEHSKPASDMLESILDVYHGELYSQLAEKGYAVGPVFTGHFFLRGNEVCYSASERK